MFELISYFKNSLKSQKDPRKDFAEGFRGRISPLKNGFPEGCPRKDFPEGAAEGSRKSELIDNLFFKQCPRKEIRGRIRGRILRKDSAEGFLPEKMDSRKDARGRISWKDPRKDPEKVSS